MQYWIFKYLPPLGVDKALKFCKAFKIFFSKSPFETFTVVPSLVVEEKVVVVVVGGFVVVVGGGRFNFLNKSFKSCKNLLTVVGGAWVVVVVGFGVVVIPKYFKSVSKAELWASTWCKDIAKKIKITKIL